jgi:DHA1 family multidrug resistance protein-like MFS transporter
MSLFAEHGNKEVNWKRNLAILWVGVYLACASYTSCIPFLPVYLMKDLNVAPENVNYWTGFVFSVAFVGSSLMAPYWGAWADKVGQRKMAIRAGLGLALTYVLGAVVQTPFQLFLVRALTGIISGFVPASLALVSSTLPENKIGWGMGMMQTAVSTGNILGPLMGGYLSAWFGMRTSFFLGAVSLFLATVMVIYFVHDIPIPKEQRKQKIHLVQDIKEVMHNRELVYVMVMFFLIQVCIMIIQPLVTLYVGDLMGGTSEASVKMSGWAFSLVGIAGIIAGPYWGGRGQRHGYMRMCALVLFGAGIINICQILVTDVWQFAGMRFVLGLFLTGAVPNINSHMVEVTEKSMRGKAFGLTTSANQMGGVVGPVLGGFLGAALGTKYVFVLTGVILVIVAGYAYVTRVKRPAWLGTKK